MKRKDPNFRNVTNEGKRKSKTISVKSAPFFLLTKTDDTDVRNSAFVVEMNDDNKDDEEW